jgi:hypothetical protein
MWLIKLRHRKLQMVLTGVLLIVIMERAYRRSQTKEVLQSDRLR